MFGFDKPKNNQKIEGDPVAADAFAARLRQLEPGASDKDIEMAANALALKFGKGGNVADKDVIDMYRERLIARPETPEDRAKIEATLDRH